MVVPLKSRLQGSGWFTDARTLLCQEDRDSGLFIKEFKMGLHHSTLAVVGEFKDSRIGMTVVTRTVEDTLAGVRPDDNNVVDFAS